VMEGNQLVTEDNWNGGVQTDLATERLRIYEPWAAMPVAAHSAQEAYEVVLDSAGAILPRRDAVDTRIVGDVRSGGATFEGKSYRLDHGEIGTESISGIIDTQQDVGGWPELPTGAVPTDTDKDGMPDGWEDANNLDKHNPEDRNTVTPDGYTMLENYLNGIR
ncbi:MAG: hypothetical protein WA952_04775, partial [Lewinella sp.]